ncbi:hypothetical protein N9948_00155 [bacterium]|nr:hypothetical protein [bacterium]
MGGNTGNITMTTGNPSSSGVNVGTRTRNLSMSDAVAMFQFIAPDKIMPMTEHSKTITWALTEEFINQNNFDEEYLLSCFVELLDILDNFPEFDLKVIRTIIFNTKSRKNLLVYERSLGKIKDANYVWIKNEIEKRKKAIPNAVDFIKED